MGIININYKLENLMLYFIVFFILKIPIIRTGWLWKQDNSLKFNIEQVKMKGNNVKQILEIRLTN